jgi:uncharacterized protein (DUF927 family)
VLIPLCCPIPANDFPALWQHVKRETGLPLDENAKDACRMFYMPAIASANSPYEFYTHGGEFLDWQKLPLDLSETDEKPENKTTSNNQTNAAAFEFHEDRHAELCRKIEAQGKSTGRGTFEMKCPVHNGNGNSSLFYAPATQIVACIKKPTPCSYFDILTAFGLSNERLPSREHKEKIRTTALTPQNFELIKNGEGDVPGVYYIEDDGKKTWTFSPLEIVAETQTQTGENYGRLLRWTDSKGRVHTWAMPLALVHDNGVELVKYLVSRGLLIGASRNHHDRLKNYINLSQPQDTIICTDKIGWHDNVFVLPDETIGISESKIVYQPEYAPAHKFDVEGTLEEWQENISKYCIGNSRLGFGVSLAFAPVLLPIVEMQSGGFHYRGGTSGGKTTAAKASGSVWGGSSQELNYCESWKVTANALEAIAEMHNHSLLCLDELAQIDPRQAGDVAYMLANGSGKGRMAKTITARRSLSWRLLFLSTGEISLADRFLFRIFY